MTSATSGPGQDRRRLRRLGLLARCPLVGGPPGRPDGGTLEVVMTWEWPSSYGWAVPVPDDFDPEADVRQAARHCRCPVRGRPPRPDIGGPAGNGSPGAGPRRGLQGRRPPRRRQPRPRRVRRHADRFGQRVLRGAHGTARCSCTATRPEPSGRRAFVQRGRRHAAAPRRPRQLRPAPGPPYVGRGPPSRRPRQRAQRRLHRRRQRSRGRSRLRGRAPAGPGRGANSRDDAGRARRSPRSTSCRSLSGSSAVGVEPARDEDPVRARTPRSPARATSSSAAPHHVAGRPRRQREVEGEARLPPGRRPRRGGPVPGIERMLVGRDVEHVGVVPEDLLGAVAVVHVPVDDQHPLAPRRARRRGDGDVVDETEAHGPVGGRVVTGRPDRARTRRPRRAARARPARRGPAPAARRAAAHESARA